MDLRDLSKHNLENNLLDFLIPYAIIGEVRNEYLGEVMQFTILSQNVLNLKAAFEKLNKKAEKYNTDKLDFVTVDEPYLKDNLLWQDIEVAGMIPVVGDFTLVGVLETLSEGTNIVKTVPGENLPEEYRNNSFFCDHCQTNRYRKEVIVVRNNETGECIQLGKNCLKDYLGISLEHLVNRFSWLNDLIENNSDPDFQGSGSTIYSCSVRHFLATCAKVINTIGFVSKKQADIEERMSTSNLCYDIVFGTRVSYINRLIAEYSLRDLEDKEYELADAALAWIKDVNDSGNDYLYNLKVISGQEEVSSKRFGFLASLIPAYQRHLGFEAEKKRKLESQKDSEFVGEEKKRMVFEDLEVVFIRLIDTAYGTSTMIKFIDPNGNNLVWFGSGNITEYNVGEKYTVKATVKKHDTYNGISQTVINRVKLETVKV